jgi:hypothetical protein
LFDSCFRVILGAHGNIYLSTKRRTKQPVVLYHPGNIALARDKVRIPINKRQIFKVQQPGFMKRGKVLVVGPVRVHYPVLVAEDESDAVVSGTASRGRRQAIPSK